MGTRLTRGAAALTAALALLAGCTASVPESSGGGSVQPGETATPDAELLEKPPDVETPEPGTESATESAEDTAAPSSEPAPENTGTEDVAEDTASSPPPVAPASTVPAPVIEVSDSWAHVMGDGEVRVFGVFTNGADQDVLVVSASSAGTDRVELAETFVHGVRAPVTGTRAEGFVIPAGRALTLDPEGDHLSLVGMEDPSGRDVEVTLHFGTGHELTWRAPVRTP